MSNFGYNQLQEERSSSAVVAISSTASKQPTTASKQPTTASKQPKTATSAFATRPHLDPLPTNNETESKAHRQDTDRDLRSNSDSVRYTALRPTTVRELRVSDVGLDDVDPEGIDSSILVTITASKKRRCIPKIYAIICALLIGCFVLLAFGLIYVFVILPEVKAKGHHPDPRVHSEDTVKSLDNCVVKTSCGSVRGIKESTTCVFRGIPYAVPPIGARRWKHPIAKDTDPSTCWQGIYSAVNYGSMCVQPSFVNTSVVQGSEDCLYLNVWSPAGTSSASLPVMVWFHSGDFVYGSGHMLGMSPTSETATATNSVFVSFNYRLGALGFLAVDELREEAGGAAGNYGFMDQQMVLTWVKTNIGRFGGNENSITIFGHGSGATSVHAMLLSPGSNGFFHKAWLTSPVVVINKTVDDACRDNKSFMRSSGCTSAQCMRRLAVDKVSRSSPWQLQPHWTLQQLFGIPWNRQPRDGLTIVDGHVIHMSSLNSKVEGPAVPVIFGSSYFDLSSLDTLHDIVNMTWEEYNILMARHVEVFSSDAVSRANSLYSYTPRPDYTIPTKFSSIPSYQFLHLLGDIKNVCPVKLIADSYLSMLPTSSRVYMYVADVFPSFSNKLTRNESNTFVGWDLAAFFGTFRELGFGVAQGELNFQNIVREEVMSFVRSGQPDASRWRTLDVNVGVIGYDVTVSPVTSEYFTQCDFWRQFGFFKYTWRESG